MQARTLLCAAALCCAALSAQAENISINVPLVPNAAAPGSFSAGVGVTHVAAGTFTDTLTFTGAPGAGFASASLVTIGFADSQNINFTSVSLNGQSFALTSTGGVDVASLSTVNFSGPLVLTVQGVAAAGATIGSAISASYGGTLNISPVPETEPLAMLLAGLGVVALLSRKRLGN